MSTNRPNIIYLFSDQHRHDAMGCAGNDIVQTPNLDGLAEEGARFSRMYCQSPVCQPSRASVITGLYTHQHGVARNFGADFDPAWPTLMKNLQKAGYATAEIGKTHFFSPRQGQAVDTPDGPEMDLRQFEGFVQSFGFDHVVEEFDRYVHAFPQVRMITPYTEHLKAKGRLEPYQKQVRSVWRMTPHHWDGVTSVLPQEDDLTCFLADQAIDWLRRRKKDQPFFLMLSFVQPHVPLMADPVWAARYQDTNIPRGPSDAPTNAEGVWREYLEKGLYAHSNSHLLTDEYVLTGARQYYGMISLIDQRIGDVLKTLKDMGLDENTWIVYSADHGEMLGDHHLMAKMNFYKSSVLVPGIIRPPQGMAPRVVDALTENIDLTATLLDIAGAEPLPGSQGRSLLPVVQGGPAPERTAAFSAIETRALDAYFVMAATDQYRLTVERNSGAVCEFFDLEKDPNEMDNRANDPACQGIIRDMGRDLIDPYLALPPVSTK